MALYAIGDVQGCFRDLMRLLELVDFDPGKDQLWFAGDLVNRGPDSLHVLRFVMELGESAVTVLGNHDLHLLAISQGNLKHQSKDHTLDPILQAPDRDELLAWLRQRPLMHHCEERKFSLLHAGLPPQWDIPTALSRAREVEETLQGDGFHDYCAGMYGNEPRTWSDDLTGMGRLRYITNVFTRLRFLDKEGRPALKEKGAPGSQARGLVPWFAHPERVSRRDRILFGHWSTLGYLAKHNIWSLDTGCLWGGKLTALQLRKGKSPKPHQIPCRPHKRPKGL
jgi:bis(5'-nucleosyl)-tetraphosphatase (symmetrical)